MAIVKKKYYAITYIHADKKSLFHGKLKIIPGRNFCGGNDSTRSCDDNDSFMITCDDNDSTDLVVAAVG